jgi:DNA-binding phage protein
MVSEARAGARREPMCGSQGNGRLSCEDIMSDFVRGHEDLKPLTSLNELLDREGLREEVTLRAFKRFLALQLGKEMEAQRLSKSVMARRMGTSRAQLDRVLDPDEYNITVETLLRVAKTLGKRLRLELV